MRSSLRSPQITLMELMTLIFYNSENCKKGEIIEKNNVTRISQISQISGNSEKDAAL